MPELNQWGAFSFSFLAERKINTPLLVDELLGVLHDIIPILQMLRVPQQGVAWLIMAPLGCLCLWVPVSQRLPALKTICDATWGSRLSSVPVLSLCPAPSLRRAWSSACT